MSSYDEIFYPGYAFPQTHPDRLATLATLAGMRPAPVERCRVLELGCGDGSNLLPMALGLPESEFVGIDLAARPVAEGRELAARLGLKNVDLRQLDVLEFGEEFGQFDYVIAHGLYSWVPPAVRDKALAVCRAHLAPQGVAFVSYNAKPGFHVRQMLREMLLFHTRNINAPRERITQAKALLRFLLEAQADGGDDPYRVLLRKEAERAAERTDGHFFHDDLEEFNEPFYFYEFVERAAQNGLQYLSEADYFETRDTSVSPQAAEKLRGLGDNLVVKEQYADFVKCRRFRQTLLCHAEVELEREPRPEFLRDFYAASPARPASAAPDVKSAAVEKFEGARGATMQTDHPLAKAAIVHLGAHWPRALSLDELLAGARARLGRDDADSLEQDAHVLREILLRLYGVNLVELHAHAPRFASQAGERPVASPLARLQAERSPVVTSLRHTSVRMDDELGRRLLLLLDGTRDRAALAGEFLSLAASGDFTLAERGEPLTDERRLREILSEQIEENLASLARHALLTA